MAVPACISPGCPEYELAVGIFPAAHGDGGKGAPVLGVAAQAVASPIEKRPMQVRYSDCRMNGKLTSCVAVQALVGRGSDEGFMTVAAPFYIRMGPVQVSGGPDRGGCPP